MKWFAFLGAVIACDGLLLAGNLVPEGDFSATTAKTIGTWCRSEDGRFSLFNEDLVWNNCCKLEVSVVRSARGHQTRSAIVGFGRDGSHYGFAVRGDTTYGFSLDLKDGGVKSASVRVIAWNGDDYWKDRTEVKVTPALRGLKLEESWKTFKGSFKTPTDAKRAAIQVSIYSTDEYGGKLHPDGAHVLIDNIKVEESVHNLGAAPKDVSVPRRKALATGIEANFDWAAAAPDVKIRALVEGQIANMYERTRWIGDFETIKVTGGASRSRGICETIAAIFKAKVEVIDMPDSAAVGGARLAARVR